MPVWTGEFMALGCGLCWAISVMLFRRMGAVDPWVVNLFKNIVASALLLLTLLAMGRGLDWTRSTEDWCRLAGSALLGLTLGDTLFFAGIQRIGASVAAVTDCAYSPLVVGLSVLLLGETISGGLVLGVPLVVAGLVTVAWNKPGSLRVDRKGVAFALGGVVASALGVIVAKPALVRSNLIEATTVRLIVGALSLVLVQAATGRLRVSLAVFRPQPLWRALLPASVMGTYISMILWLGGIKYAPASRAALLNQMATVFMLLLSRLSGEIVPKRRWLGAGLALAGAVAVLVG